MEALQQERAAYVQEQKDMVFAEEGTVGRHSQKTLKAKLETFKEIRGFHEQSFRQHCRQLQQE
eukprot:454792-Karenia_brevis.AAC.1